jgi:hypothetical protein
MLGRINAAKKQLIVTPQAAVKILLFHGGMSMVCIPLFILLGGVGWIRAWSAAIGCTTAILASGEGVWMSIRLRHVRCALMTGVALLALLFWAWVLYLRVYGHDAA